MLERFYTRVRRSGAFEVLVLCCLATTTAFVGYGSALGWEAFTGDRIVAANNFAVFMGNLAAGSAALLILHRTAGLSFWLHPRAKLLFTPWVLLGLAIYEYSWALHRGYWYVWRVARSLGFDAFAELMVESANIMTALPVMGIMWGMALALSPALRRAFRDHWITIVLVFYTTLWLVGFHSIDFWQLIIGCDSGSRWQPEIGQCLGN